MHTLPVIDISPLYRDDPAARAAVVADIDAACRHAGFFYISGHPITPAKLAPVRAAMQDFFARPLDEKLAIDITRGAYHRGYGAIAIEQLDPMKPGDFKETFDMGYHIPADHPDVVQGKPLRGPNWHPDIAGWETLFENHYRDMHAVSLVLLRAIAQALGAPEDFFDVRFHAPISVFRMIHYPPRDAGIVVDNPSAGAHTDYGCITLLHQDQSGGLQVRSLDGQWIEATPVEGTFVVNIGDMMARWSNDRYKSTLHRVISPPGVHRYSMPFFVEPNPDTVIDCLPGCFDEDNPPKYPVTTCSDYMLSRFADTYKYRQSATETAA